MSLEADDAHILADPLGFLRTECYRQRVACNTLEALAHSESDGDACADAERVLRYVVEEVPVLIAGLEECLFPLLAQRAAPGDRLDELLEQWRDGRVRYTGPAERLVAILRRVAAGAAPPAELRSVAATLTAARRQNLTRETEQILPLAEKNLTKADLAALGRAIVERRSIDHRT